MSDQFWSKLSHITGLLALAALIGLTAFATNLEVRDLDIWLHLRTGQYIAEHHTVPHVDVLSNTIASKPWTNHEWLFQLIVYHIHRFAGFDGLLTMQSVLVCLTLLLLFLMTYRRDRILLGVYTLLLTMLVFQSRFTLRPDLFSLFFFTLFMNILAFHLDQRRSIIAAGVIQILWANIHGYFFFGPLLVLIALVSESLKRFVPLPYEWGKIGRLSDMEYKNLGIMFVVVLGACLCNPYFVDGALYPVHVLFRSASDTRIFFQYITELQPPFTKNFLTELHENVHYKLMLLISGMMFFFNRRKIDISVLLVWVVFLLFSLVAIRNLVFFACAAYLVIMINSMTVVLTDILPLRFDTKKFEYITSILAKVALIGWILNCTGDFANRGYFDYDTYKTKMEIGGVSKKVYPQKPVDFMIAQGIRGNIFNDFNSGAYLIGRMYPQVKVFIDGRTEVYGGKFFEYYKKIWVDGDKKTLLDAIERYHLTVAFLNGAKQNIVPKTIRTFYSLKDWKLVYFDEDGMIFLKKTPQNQPIIDRFAVDLTKWEPKPMDLVKLGMTRVVPWPNIARAKLLMALKLDGPALKELKVALKIAPEAVETYGLLGDIYGHQKKYQLAFENFRIASGFSSSYHNVMGMAWSLNKIGKPQEARKLYEALQQKNPKDKIIAARLREIKAKDKK